MVPLGVSTRNAGAVPLGFLMTVAPSGNLSLSFVVFGEYEAAVLESFAELVQ